jgi:hypothetical protein
VAKEAHDRYVVAVDLPVAQGQRNLVVSIDRNARGVLTDFFDAHFFAGTWSSGSTTVDMQAHGLALTVNPYFEPWVRAPITAAQASVR